MCVSETRLALADCYRQHVTHHTERHTRAKHGPPQRRVDGKSTIKLAHFFANCTGLDKVTQGGFHAQLCEQPWWCGNKVGRNTYAEVVGAAPLDGVGAVVVVAGCDGAGCDGAVGLDDSPLAGPVAAPDDSPDAGVLLLVLAAAPESVL